VGVPATFFVVGRRVAAHPEALRAILAAGHEVGNHSQSHDVFLAAQPGARIRREVLACQEVLAGLGVRPRAFRPPVGITSPPMARALEALGLRCVAFSCRPLDFGNRRLDDMAERVLRRVPPGDYHPPPRRAPRRGAGVAG
jgi:peptidoglycan/xylan/chitin deacetylase (PgdA/CDA1 family)